MEGISNLEVAQRRCHLACVPDIAWLRTVKWHSRMGKANKQWHARNRMPRNPTRDQRIKWHWEHAKNCTCRSMPIDIAEKVDRLGYEKSNSAYNLATAARIIGIMDAPSDLSTNAQNFKKFGKK